MRSGVQVQHTLRIDGMAGGGILEQATRIGPEEDTHGLPPCLVVPIASKSVEAIEDYVGEALRTVVASRSLKRRVNAILVRPYVRAGSVRKDPKVPLWTEPTAREYEERLYPERQVWVHVDYAGYRNTYIGFGMPILPYRYVLDHVQNREVVRKRREILGLTDYSHPFLRLCPVLHAVNTSGGSRFGIEGAQKE